jgi:sRNA-binding regulator protein Hfq
MKEAVKPAFSHTEYSQPQRPEESDFGNRKLIRPTLARSERLESRAQRNGDRHENPNRQGANGQKKNSPPEQTHAESFYFQKQMVAKTLMVIRMNDGEEIRGVIEWYDKNCIKVNRSDGKSNLMIYKAGIKYIYKEST